MEYALVTGGSQGIGRAIARELAGRGYGVFLAALDNSFLDETAADEEGGGIPMGAPGVQCAQQ